MTTLLFAGGGTAGHVNPLLATADRVRDRTPDIEVLVLGTREGLEADLVPERGYELLTIEKLPFPRRPDLAAIRFPAGWLRAVRRVRRIIRERSVTAVVGFGGYAAAPAYRAAKLEGIPIVIHEANAIPGMANRLGAKWAAAVGVSYRSTQMPRSEFVGMPLRSEITDLDRDALRPQARQSLGLDASRPTMLVTGGSQGARSVNRAVVAAAADIVDAGWQILHLSGGRQSDFEPAQIDHYTAVEYLREMHLALAATDFVVCRAGSLTVAELGAVGLPAVYVPLPYGNGEQRRNAQDQLDAGGAVIVKDEEFTPQWIRQELVPMLQDTELVSSMAQRSRATGVRDGADRMASMIERVIS